LHKWKREKQKLKREREKNLETLANGGVQDIKKITLPENLIWNQVHAAWEAHLLQMTQFGFGQIAVPHTFQAETWNMTEEREKQIYTLF